MYTHQKPKLPEIPSLGDLTHRSARPSAPKPQLEALPPHPSSQPHSPRALLAHTYSYLRQAYRHNFSQREEPGSPEKIRIRDVDSFSFGGTG